MKSVDAFNEDEAEFQYLLSKPACFLLLGKPGCGKATLARKFARAWKCVYITIPDAIQYAILRNTEFGQQANSLLCNGEVVPDELSYNLLKEMIESPKVQHHGYILLGFPLSGVISEQVEKQIDFINKLSMKPDYIINLKIPDEDLVKRRAGVKVDPVTNKLFTKENYSEWDNQNEKEDHVIEEDDQGEEEVDEEVATEEDDILEEEEDEEVVEDFEKEENSKDLLQKLIVRVDDFEENIHFTLKNYKESLLLKLEDYISQHNQNNVFEIDANLNPNVIFKILMNLLQTASVSRPPVPIRLQGSEDVDEVAEDTDTDDMLRTLATSEMIAPGFRWRRSKWGRLCPVSLYEGSVKMGNPQFSVSFLDKMFLMASEETLLKFSENPRKYVLPPQPAPPCKIIILGAPLSGVTTLCNKLKHRYNCKVFDVDELVKPRQLLNVEKIRKEHYADLLVKSIAKVENIEREKLKLTQKKDKEKEGDSDEDKSDEEEEEEQLPIVVTEVHPLVQELIEEGIAKVGSNETPLSTVELIDCLEESLMESYEGTDNGPSSGGWILDNFPHTKDQLNMMIERGIVPDDVIVFREDSANSTTLHDRWNNMNILNADSSTSLTEEEHTEFNAFKRQTMLFDQSWTSMQSAMRNAHSLEPLLVPCKLDIEEAFNIAIKKIEDAFQYRAWEYTGMDQDEEEEDIAAMAEEEEENEDDDDTNKNKPFGETKHFCPVALKNQNVLWPGLPECAVKYRERVYFLSTPEAKDSFLENPDLYLPKDKPLAIPPVRLILLGVKGSGKTFHGRMLAKKYGLFHISFKDRLQELILHKTLKKVGPEFEFPEDNIATLKENLFGLEEKEDDEGAEKEVDVELDLTQFEENIYNNILDGEPLTKETLDEIIPAFWNVEPFKSKGFLLEGFPRTAEETRYLAEMGFFPDGVLNFIVEDTNICTRLLQPILERWKSKQIRIHEAKLKDKNEKLKQREEERARRKVEKLGEIEERKAEKLAAQQALGEGEGEEYEEEVDLDEIIEYEMLEEYGDLNEEDDDDEETTEEAVERIKIELTEKFEEEITTLESIYESLQDISVPIIEIDAGRKFHISQYLIEKALKSQVNYRHSLFDRCKSVSPTLAKRLINQGYKLLSRFGRWCPVELYNKAVLPPYVTATKPLYPVIYRHYIYFLSSENCKEQFIQSPITYINQEYPKPVVPIKIAIIGPPKSGKTTSKRFAKEYGLVRLSMGEALRKILVTHAHTHIVKEIKQHLDKGYVVPDELAIQVFEIYLLEPQCMSRGFVLDGFPCTIRQMELLRERSIIPYKIFDLTIPDKVIMQRGLVDRKSSQRTLPLHDSHTILAIRIACHRRESTSIRQFFNYQYKNLFTLDGEKSKWWVYNTAKIELNKSVTHIQTYIQRICNHQAASIKYMCITPDEIKTRLGEFGEYCPVHLERGELWDCSDDCGNNLLAEHHGKYYKFATKENMDKFIDSPNTYIYPLAPNKLPSKESLPKRRNAGYVKKVFPAQLELKGYCPVTYLDADLRYEAIIPGDKSFVVEYKKKLFCFATEDHLLKFMRCPKKYSSLSLPHKLPPKREPVNVSSLPMLGYMEQTVSTAIIKALTAVGCMKPKFPFLSAKESATLYLGYHLKAYNPKSKEYVRDKYKKQLHLFQENCELISYLSRIMNRKFCEIEDRPIDFNHKLSCFMELQFT